ncbi:MAG: PASTA domain-containing protein [Ruminococcus sp.]|nr:PASTA domain-containing protein [Ruminococcus sp.]
MGDKPTVLMRKRLSVWIGLAMLVVIVWIVINIFKTAVIEGEEYRELANAQQLTSTTIKANRGSIVDSNMEVLAQSSTVYTIYLDPNTLSSYLSDDPEATVEEIANKLGEILDIEPETVIEASEKNLGYVELKKNVEKTTYDEVIAYKKEINCGAIGANPTTKRYYPQSDLASSVIGHTHYDGYGLLGLEAYYDDYLTGTDGKSVTATGNNGKEMPYRYKQNYDAVDGSTLVLNIDINIQEYLEKALKEAVELHEPEDRACGIVMDPNTGEILAMATTPSYDLNNPSEIYDEETAAELAALKEKEEAEDLAGTSDDEEETTDEYGNVIESDDDDENDEETYEEALNAAWSLQWKNKAVSELYYPGSVFKVITGSSALEENAINLTQTFSCNTKYTVADTTISCWSTTDHGLQTFAEAMTNSCNPAFIQIGLALGADKFFDYFEAFGFTETTGIDLPAEASSITYTKDTAGIVELATSSFGQANKITPIQMITAYAAVINGGYLVTPQVVDKIIDANGNVVEDYTPVIKRQVISEETSETMREVLKNVVESQPGSNSYIKGYSIGGKSGTSEKLDENEGQHVASYCAFYPAEDPELIILIMVDGPTSGECYGSQIAAPAVTSALEEILPYLGYYPEYSEEELDTLSVYVPTVTNQSVSDAETTIEGMGLVAKVVGEGSKVVAQTPSSGNVQVGGTVVLYTEDDYEQELLDVPNVYGMTMEAAQELLQESGFNVTFKGEYEEDGEYCSEQSPLSTAQAYEGTAVTVTMTTSSASGDSSD